MGRGPSGDRRPGEAAGDPERSGEGETRGTESFPGCLEGCPRRLPQQCPHSWPCRQPRLLREFSTHQEMLESHGRLMIRQVYGDLDPQRPDAKQAQKLAGGLSVEVEIDDIVFDGQFHVKATSSDAPLEGLAGKTIRKIKKKVPRSCDTLKDAQPLQDVAADWCAPGIYQAWAVPCQARRGER
ncbi:hypothetical protein AK812_SmicGene43715 [Symbiodinium microadriaticum]|uniref:Uncharacterized protein n=1 Tax=Symbiodinium microadriaticum TaxID=2951 RepID=A0A1Q9C0B3_SYMMI|nr:hypothetical protein AK812_SmicGene43715 [Symbiodinium microadriaticum]